MLVVKQLMNRILTYPKQNLSQTVVFFSTKCVPKFNFGYTLQQKVLLNFPRAAHDNVTSINIKKRPQRKKKPLTEDEPATPGLYNVTAFSTAEEYDLDNIVRNLKEQGLYEPKKIENNDEVVHAVAKYQVGKEPREIFIFKEGSVVLWNITELESSNILTFLREFEQDSYSSRLVGSESEIMKYRYHTEEE